MLTRIRIETFNIGHADAQAELDMFELAILKAELVDIGNAIPGLKLDEVIAIEEAISLFDNLGEGAITRKLSENSIRASEDGDGYVGRRIVRYDGGVYAQPE